MARLPRICPPGIPQHIIQRGNNRHVCFACERDFSAYANWLKDYSQQHSVAIHAWVFMTNGESKYQRVQGYRSLFKAHVEGELLEEIRNTVNQGMALGNERFKDEIEAISGRRVRPAKMGRPKKSLI